MTLLHIAILITASHTSLVVLLVMIMAEQRLLKRTLVERIAREGAR